MENPTKATPLIKCLSPYIRVVAHWKHLLLVIDENDHFFQINTQKDFELERIHIPRYNPVACIYRLTEDDRRYDRPLRLSIDVAG